MNETVLEDNMSNKIGLSATTKSVVQTRPPRLLIISGATGVGKSTTSTQIAAEMKFSRIISTDAIREIMRACDGQPQNPALHRSSFSKGETGDPIIDWTDTCNAVEAGIFATIDRARREGIDLLIEGVHIRPDNQLLREWRQSGGIALGVVLHVSDQSKHEEMLKQREEYSHRSSNRYINNIKRIRSIQEEMVDRTKITGWACIDVGSENEVKRIKHYLDLEWNSIN